MRGDTPMILFAALSTNIIVTVAIVLAYVLIFWGMHLLMKKHEDQASKLLLFSVYLLEFILLLAAIIGIFLTWGMKPWQYLIDSWDDVSRYLLQKIGALIGTAAVIFVIKVIFKISKIALNHVAKREGPTQKRRQTIAKVSKSIIRYVLYILGFIAILAVWGVNVLPALAGLGILGLVIGLGAQELINDIISGFFIIFERHFDIGDTIEVGGFKGVVTSIGLKTTKVRNWRGVVKIINNGDVKIISNYTIYSSLAVVEFGIAYESDVDEALRILEENLPEVAEKYESIIGEPTVAGVTELADSSVNIRVTVETLAEQHYGVERGFLKDIKKILDDNDIEIPFPQVVVNKKGE